VASSSLITLFNDQKATYNFDKISVAAGLVSFCLYSKVYGISFGCPYIITFVMKIMGSDLCVVDVRLFLYSLSAFMAIA
jgi:hypothetical protein